MSNKNEDYEIKVEDMKRGQEVDEYIKKLGKTPAVENGKKGLVATIVDGEVKISMVNISALDALEIVAGIIVKVSVSTKIIPSKIMKDLIGFVKYAMNRYIDSEKK